MYNQQRRKPASTDSLVADGSAARASSRLENVMPDTLTVVEIPLAGEKYAGAVALVDAEDADLADRKWYGNEVMPKSTSGARYVYASSSRRGEKYMHRVILARIVGRPLTRRDHCDHVNGNRLDNRRSNLRLATHTQNMANRSAAMSFNGQPVSSTYKGVARNGGRWAASIGGCGTRQYKYLGMFDTEEEAARAYNAAALERYGQYALLNEVPE